MVYELFLIKNLCSLKYFMNIPDFGLLDPVDNYVALINAIGAILLCKLLVVFDCVYTVVTFSASNCNRCPGCS